MKAIILDTETTGLPDFHSPYKNTPEWYKAYPDIVQISWIIYDMDNDKVIDMKDYYINIDYKMPENVIKIHGITDEILKKKGKPLEYMLPSLVTALKSCDVIVGHNIDFDINMIRSNMIRYNNIDIFGVIDIDTYCTKKESKKYLNVKKYPKLVELHERLFQQNPKNLHNSFNDVLVTLRCYYKIVKGNDIMTKNMKIKSFLSKIL